MIRFLSPTLLIVTAANAGLDVPPPAPVDQTARTAAAAAQAQAAAAASKSDLATLQASIPIAGTSTPPPDTSTGAAGSGLTYQPANAIRPSRVRTGNCALTVTGQTASCSGLWDGSGFPAMMNGQTVTPQPLGDPAVVNPTMGAVFKCNWATVTMTGYSVFCTQEKSTLLNLTVLGNGLTLSPSGAAPATSVVYVTGIAKLTS